MNQSSPALFRIGKQLLQKRCLNRAAFSPINLLWAIVYPGLTIPESLRTDPTAGRVTLVIGALLAGAFYTTGVYLMHSTMKRSFMMTVRKLAGST